MMKLFLSPTSPFARKVKVALMEKNLYPDVEEIPVDPWSSPAELIRANPLCQVPTLVTGEGFALANSDSILDWLESRFPEPALRPANDPDRGRAMAVAAQAHGLMQYTVDIVLERRRPASQRSATFTDRRMAAIGRVVTALGDRFLPTPGFGIDGIGVACALGYLDLRLPEYPWRERSPSLTRWFSGVASRPSLQASAPPV